MAPSTSAGAALAQMPGRSGGCGPLGLATSRRGDDLGLGFKSEIRSMAPNTVREIVGLFF